MRLAQAIRDGRARLMVAAGDGWREITAGSERQGGSLSTLLEAVGPDALLSAAREAASDEGGERLTVDEANFAAAADPDRILCAGRNYHEHREEMGRARTAWPEIFLRTAASLNGPYAALPKPACSDKLDYEGELGVVIGRSGRYLPAAEAESVIFGFTIVNDVSVRDWQLRGQQWTPGKNFDRTLPVGPVVVTADELDWRDLRLRTRLNGEVVQDATTAEMIFDVPTLIEFISNWTRLRPGDLICTGTPGGVGLARKPPLFMCDGDLVEVEIEGIGRIANTVVEEPAGRAAGDWEALAVAGRPDQE
jgi:acylpyruvate hydrolase